MIYATLRTTNSWIWTEYYYYQYTIGLKLLWVGVSGATNTYPKQIENLN